VGGLVVEGGEEVADRGGHCLSRCGVGKHGVVHRVEYVIVAQHVLV